MRPERVFGFSFIFANLENALAFLGYCAKATAPYAAFTTITLTGTKVRVDFDSDAIGKDVVEALSAQLLATANTFA